MEPPNGILFDHERFHVKLLEIRLVSVEFRAKNSRARVRATTFAGFTRGLQNATPVRSCVDYVSRVKNKGKGRFEARRGGGVSCGDRSAERFIPAPIIYTV